MSGGLFDHLINQFGNNKQMTTDSFNVNPQPQKTNGYNQQMALLQQQQQQMLANMGVFNGFGGMGGNNMIANFGWNQQPQYGQQNNNNLGFGYNGWR
jgi:hypothetical protein